MANKGILRLLETSSKISQINLPVVSLIIRKYSDKVSDITTHTGQKFEPDDYRLVRFVDRPKHVNPNWAINLISKVPSTPVKSRIVACDGGGGPLGHPKVYINLDEPGPNTCGYCGLEFHKEDDH
ncbi:NADH dehydrogenase [ubiquinone] iron-sulfur protein 6, mitochondrial [Polistes fuscatus]|uniref:NADH dehydrogenase [ubiquinone] iron-sulfur protein 6, mitochondrial n=1 Tax=Polistes fuscatus TaxID=30207 RepID=UPI001CA853B4|nr:NADH dehydrogenase [ubiquinone] iron-sulfur protein 6, mitochondrial [Polistes fuscatus]